MKLNRNFILHTTEGETFLVPTGNSKFSGVVRGNKTLRAVLELLAKGTDEEGIVTAMKERFDAPEDKIVRDVKKALEALRSVGAIDE